MSSISRLKIQTAALACALLMAPLAPFPAHAAPESSDPIKLAINEWTGQHTSVHIAKILLEKMGYNVELVTAGSIPQLPAMAKGDIHANPEVWSNNSGEIYPKLVNAGDIVVLGQLGLQAREGWIYPPYMEEKCPGLPNYRALYDCAAAFATAETFPNGRLVAYPADWGTRSKDVIAGIKLPFTPVAGGSDGAMIAEMESALATKKPMLMMFWSPHWLFAKHKFNFVEWNPADGECVEENQKKETACGFQQASIDKVVSPALEKKWPGAARFMRAFTVTNADHERMILEVDVNNRKVEEVAREWVDANESKWRGWIK